MFSTTVKYSINIQLFSNLGCIDGILKKTTK